MATTKTNSEKDARVAFKLIHQMNFKLLKAQKTILSNMLGKKKITNAEYATIEGMLAMIDTIQDLACDEYQHNPNDVYNFTNEVDEKIKLSMLECRKIVLEN